MNEHQELVVAQPTQLARVNPMDTLALMSEQEFEQRLDGLKTAQRRMERVQRELMKENVDYGIIPGTGDKPTLLKPGTEKLCKFHHLVPTFEVETVMGDGVTGPHIRVLTTCSLHYESEDGPIVAQGMGAANSWEKKYRWRDGQRRCPECGAAAIIKGKAEFGGGYLCWAKKGGCGAKFGDGDTSITDQQAGQIENPDPFDLENTIRKISAKRAQTDATLRATATSGLFSQDLEDIDVGESNGHRPAPAARPTPPKPASARPVAQTAPVDDAIPEIKNVGELLTWGHKLTGLNKANMLAELGVENELAIKNYAAAAGVLKRFAEESRKQQAPEATDADFTEQA